jgi:hypothetical protein
VLEEETAVFILVNFADLVLTGVSFYYGGTDVEVNPVVRWFLRTYGLQAMAFYKFALVAVVVLICQFIYPSHPKSARGILIAGSVAYGLLIAYVLITLLAHVFSTF